MIIAATRFRSRVTSASQSQLRPALHTRLHGRFRIDLRERVFAEKNIAKQEVSCPARYPVIS